MVVVEVKGKYSSRTSEYKSAEVQIDNVDKIDVTDGGDLLIKQGTDVVAAYPSGRWHSARLLRVGDPA